MHLMLHREKKESLRTYTTTPACGHGRKFMVTLFLSITSRHVKDVLTKGIGKAQP